MYKKQKTMFIAGSRTNGKYKKWIVVQFITGVSCGIPCAIFYGDNCKKYAVDHAERLNKSNK